MMQTYQYLCTILIALIIGVHSAFHGIQHQHHPHHQCHHHPHHHHRHLPTSDVRQSQRQELAPTEFLSGSSGLFAHPLDCTKFLNCDRGRTFVEDCGPSNGFNDVLKVCDWLYNVNCGTRSFNGMSGTRSNTNTNTNLDSLLSTNGVNSIGSLSNNNKKPDQLTRTQFIQFPSQSLVPPQEEIIPNTELSSNRIGRVDESFGGNSKTVPRIGTRMVVGSETSLLHSKGVQEANVIKPQENLNVDSHQIPELSLLTSRVVSDFQNYFMNPKPKSTPSMVNLNSVDQNSSNLPDNTDIENAQNRLGEGTSQNEQIEKSTKYFQKFSKDQEPIMPIYDQSITLTMTPRPYQMPKSYNHNYYQSLIQPVDERDETDGMPISDSMKKLLRPYMTKNDKKKDQNVVTKAPELSSTDQRFGDNGAFISTTTEKIVVESTPSKTNHVQLPYGQNSQQHPIRLPPGSKVPIKNDPDRIVFPGAHSESRPVYGYYHKASSSQGFTPPVTQMRPIHRNRDQSHS